MQWVRQGPDNHQLTYILEKVRRPLLLYPMNICMHIKLPSLWDFGLTSPRWEYFSIFSLPLLSLPVCVQHNYFRHNFRPWLACTSVPAWDLALVDYCPLQFHRAIHAVSVLRIILCLWECNWQQNWYYL